MENEQYRIEFKAELEVYMQQNNTYEENKVKAYAFFWEHCSKGMQSRIESREDYEHTIKGDILELMPAIKEVVIDKGRDVQFVMVGAGPGLADAKQMATDLGIDDWVTFTGRWPDEERR